MRATGSVRSSRFIYSQKFSLIFLFASYFIIHWFCECVWFRGFYAKRVFHIKDSWIVNIHGRIWIIPFVYFFRQRKLWTSTSMSVFQSDTLHWMNTRVRFIYIWSPLYKGNTQINYTLISYIKYLKLRQKYW